MHMGSLTFPTSPRARSAASALSSGTWTTGLRSGTASGLLWRRAPGARSAACHGPCRDFCLRRAGGPVGAETPAARAMAFATPWHSSGGYSHSSSVAKRHRLSHQRPHGACECLPSHGFRRHSNSVELVTKEDLSFRRLPHMQA